MEFKYVVSIVGCILKIDARKAEAWKSAGLEVFDTYAEAEARYMSMDDTDKQALVYFEAM